MTAAPQGGAAVVEAVVEVGAAGAQGEAEDRGAAVAVREVVAAEREVAVVLVAAALAHRWDKLAAAVGEAPQPIVAETRGLNPGQMLLAPMPIVLR